MKLIIDTILADLAANKRIVVPQLGAFLMKQSTREVLFSEFLKQDDGELRAQLSEQGLSAIEAAGAVNRFVFEVRHVINRGESYPLEGLGSLSLDLLTRKITFTPGEGAIEMQKVAPNATPTPNTATVAKPRVSPSVTTSTLYAERRVDKGVDELQRGGLQERLDAAAAAARGALSASTDSLPVIPTPMPKPKVESEPIKPVLEKSPITLTRQLESEAEAAATAEATTEATSTSTAPIVEQAAAPVSAETFTLTGSTTQLDQAEEQSEVEAPRWNFAIKIDMLMVVAYIVLAFALGSIAYSLYVKALARLWGIV